MCDVCSEVHPELDQRNCRRITSSGPDTQEIKRTKLQCIISCALVSEYGPDPPDTEEARVAVARGQCL